MNIEEFRVARYGPLPDSGRVMLNGFNVIFGENEDGKTLRIDALVKMMFGAKVKDFEEINRVEEKPEGYLIVKDQKNKKWKIPEQGTLTKITELSPSEGRNIFIIRNSDLTVTASDTFYSSLADQLVGLRTNELSTIKNKLQEIGKLTPSGTFSNKGENLKDRFDNASDLLIDIQATIDQAKSNDLDKIEIENVKLEDERQNNDNLINLLEDARKREKFQKGKDALAKIRNDQHSLKELSAFNRKEEESWKLAKKQIDLLQPQRDKLSSELQNLKSAFTADTQSLEREKSEFGIFQATKEKLTQEIKPEITRFENDQAETTKQESNGKFFSTLGIVSIALLMTTLLAAALTSSLLFYALAALTGVFAVLMWTKRYRIASNRGNLAAQFGTLRLRAASFGIPSDNMEGLVHGVQKFMNDFELKSADLQKKIVANKTLEGKINDIETKGIPEMDKDIEDQKKVIEGIIQSAKVTSIEDYSSKIESRSAFEVSIGEQSKVLESQFGTKGKTLEEKFASWETEIESLSDFENKAIGIQFDENQLSTVKERQTAIGSRQKAINDQLVQTLADMCEIANKANGVLRNPETIECQNLADLDATKKMIEGFISDKETTKKNVLEAIKIFSEVESEEQNKVKDLFGEKSSISNYFSEITNGMYTHVYLDPETGNVEIERKNGEKLTADKLSSGSFDQLYLSIRLALGEKLLKGSKGFFILDDPFIRADKRRLQNQVNILKRISATGWQVIYFTAKDEVKDALSSEIASKQVNLIQVK